MDNNKTIANNTESDDIPILKPTWSQVGRGLTVESNAAGAISSKEPYSWQHAAKKGPWRTPVRKDNGASHLNKKIPDDEKETRWQRKDHRDNHKGFSSRWNAAPSTTIDNNTTHASGVKKYHNTTYNVPVTKFTFQQILDLRIESEIKPDLLPSVDGVTSETCLLAETSSPLNEEVWTTAWDEAKERQNQRTNRANNKDKGNAPEWANGEEAVRSKSDASIEETGFDELAEDDVFASMAKASALMEQEKAAWRNHQNGQVSASKNVDNNDDDVDDDTFGETTANTDVPVVDFTAADPIVPSTATEVNNKIHIAATNDISNHRDPWAVSTSPWTSTIKEETSTPSPILDAPWVAPTPAPVTVSVPRVLDMNLYGDNWYYRDPSGMEQGPFKDIDMKGWLLGNFFPASLPVRRGDRSYKPLDQLFQDKSTAFTNVDSADYARIQQEKQKKMRLAEEEKMRLAELKKHVTLQKQREFVQSLIHRRVGPNDERLPKCASLIGITATELSVLLTVEIDRMRMINQEEQKKRLAVETIAAEEKAVAERAAVERAAALERIANNEREARRIEAEQQENQRRITAGKKAAVRARAAAARAQAAERKASAPQGKSILELQAEEHRKSIMESLNVVDHSKHIPSAHNIIAEESSEPRMIQHTTVIPSVPAPWGAVSDKSSAGKANNSKKTLAEIQRIEAERSGLLRGLRETESRDHGNCRVWGTAKKVAVVPRKTMAQIQAEEAAALAAMGMTRGKKVVNMAERIAANAGVSRRPPNVPGIPLTYGNMSQREQKAISAAQKKNEALARRNAAAAANVPPSAWNSSVVKPVAKIQAGNAFHLKGLLGVGRKPVPMTNRVAPSAETDFWSTPEVSKPVVASMTAVSSIVSKRTSAKEGGELTTPSKLTPEFAKWCSDQIYKMKGKKEETDLTLLEFLVSLDDASEIREYTRTYYGSTPIVSAFTTEFINRKNAQKKSGGGGKRKKKGGRY